MDVLLLPPHLAALAEVAIKDAGDQQDPLGAVLVERIAPTEAYPHGQVRLVASDRRRLVVATVDADDPAGFPEVPAFLSAPNSATRALVDAAAWRAAFRAARGRRSNGEARVAVSLSATDVTFCSVHDGGATVTPVRAVGGDYPDYRSPWPNRAAKATVTVSIPLLRGLLAALEGFARDRSEAVVIEVRGPSDPVVISTGAPDRGRAEAILMPINPAAGPVLPGGSEFVGRSTSDRK